MSNQTSPVTFLIELESRTNPVEYVEATAELAAARYAGIYQDMLKGERVTLRRNGRLISADSK